MDRERCTISFYFDQICSEFFEKVFLYGCVITCKDGSGEVYDACIIGAHAPNALRTLMMQVTFDETGILGAFHYAYRIVIFTYNIFFLFGALLVLIMEALHYGAVIFMFITTSLSCPGIELLGAPGGRGNFMI
ncbi:hypothetical protein OROMI_004911 [Orobanche minor]